MCFSTRHQRFTRVRLPDPYLTRSSAPFASPFTTLALDQQREGVWSLVLHPDSEGPALFSSAALPPFSVRHSWHTVVQALAADGADDPFGERVLPGCSGSDDHVVNSHVGQAPDEALAVDGIPIAE